METPLSSRRITRSQASIMAEQSKNGVVKSNQDKEKPALIDITNGSPIVGLAMGILKTPSSRCSKKRMIVKNSMTPGSGESLLRGQVKTLLQKVEEESGVSKNGFDLNLWCHNSPQVCNFFTGSNNLIQMLNEVICEPKQEDKDEKVKKNVITRSLFSDFSDKSHDSDSSECYSRLTCQDSDASKWSVQVNASSSEGYEDELCEGMSNISVNNGGKFTEKHIRFVYNSEGELEGELSSSSKTGDTESECF